MDFARMKINDVILITPEIFGDDRGFFLETYRDDKFSELGIGPKFVQDNHSGSQKGVLRGLHYQIQQPQGKLVRAISGEIFDVVVDLRESSKMFGQWVGTVLSAKNKQQLWMPPGFAHGFFVLSDWAEVAYKATDYYAPQFERSIYWNDPDIGIEWPITPGIMPIVSTKDSKGSPFKDVKYYI